MAKNIKNKGEIIIYQIKQGPKLDVKMEKQTVWLTQAQVGLPFDTERSVITKHLRNIFKSGELKENSVCANFAQLWQSK